MNRLRAVRDGEQGFALVFVVMVTMIVMMGVATALTVVTPNIVASRSTQDVAAAQSAAQSGIDDLVAYLSSVPSCRSQTLVCPQALGASSDALKATTRARPSLGTDQTVVWKTDSNTTTDGYVRVTSTGRANGTSRTLVADLSLQPSILAYGYYTDYESFAPQYLNDYYNARDIYLSNATTYGNVSSTNRNGASAPQTVTWKGASQAGTSARCGQHWYAESASSPGRASYATGNPAQTYWTENGTANSTSSASRAVVRSGQCDLVFTSAMVEDGLTYSRDAIYSSGSGPIFNKPVYTMWGYNDGAKKYDNPAFTTAGQYYRGNAMATGTGSSPYKPAIAGADLVLPKSIGTDALSEDSCVYYGPTRVKLNGDGTATVTSPETTTRFAAADPKCYPAALDSTGIVGFTLNYKTAGSGTIIVRNLGAAPASGWPANQTRSTNTPGAANEVFYLPNVADVAKHDDYSTANDSACATTSYSATMDATCAWTNVRTATDGGSAGWPAYSSVKCGSAATNNRQLFECEYGAQLSGAQPALNQSGGQYKAVRTAITTELAKNQCVGTTTARVACVNTIVTNLLAPANSQSSPAARNDHRYFVTSTAGTQSAGTTNPSFTNPVAGDPLFTQATPASETYDRLAVTSTVVRQVYNGSNWTTNAATPAFTLTTSLADYAYTAPQGATYFPKLADVTEYNAGVDVNGAIAGSNGTRQPGDLYVEGGNKGKLSLVADNDVIVTGNVTNPAGYTAATDAMSIVAGRNVRNFHPVTCADQDTADINKTSPGWCPNDITGLNASSNSMIDSNGNFTAAHPTQQYDNLQATGDRTVEAAIFALSGSLRTDNYDRGDWVGNLVVKGGIYQSARGGNGVVYNGSNNTRTGTTLQYTYVDLQRAELPYAPPATSGNYTRPWNVVSISAGKTPTP